MNTCGPVWTLYGPVWTCMDPAARAVGCVCASMSQSNKPACDGARQGGNGNASTEACFLSRWVRIFSITTGPSMQAMIHPAAGSAGLDVDVEHALQALCPGHGSPALGRRWLLLLIGYFGFGALPPLCRRHPRTVFAVGGEYTVKTRQANPGFGHHGGEPGDEVLRLKRGSFRPGLRAKTPDSLGDSPMQMVRYTSTMGSQIKI